MRFLSLFLFLPILLKGVESSSPEEFASLSENSSAIVGGCVNAITGDLIFDQIDLTTNAAEPLSIRRNFISREAENSFLIWDPFRSLLACSQGVGPVPQFIYICEPNGISIEYAFFKYYQEEKKSNIIAGYLPTASQFEKGFVSSSDHLERYHPANSYLTLKQGIITLYLPNGAKRIFQSVKEERELIEKCLEKSRVFFLLVKETKPNGIHIHYDYKKKDGAHSIQYIRSLSPDEQNEFSFLKLSHPKHIGWEITSSDGRFLRYHLGKYKHKNLRDTKISLVEKAETFAYPEEILHRDKNLLLKKRQFPNGREIRAEYDKKNRVTHLYGPDGLLYSLTYHKNFTEAFDSLGNRSIYFYDSNLRLTKIETYQGPSTLLKTETFKWSEEGDLLEKNLGIQSLLYSYDNRHNLIRKTLKGSITSKNQTQEEATFLYSYSEDGRNLLLKEEHPNGKVITYSYKEGTNLPTSIVIFDREKPLITKTFSYNKDNLLIRETTSDGQETHIKIIQPRMRSPFYGMADTIEERYLEHGVEKLIRKIRLHYTPKGEVSTKEIYDANGMFAYAINYTYDHKGHLTSETNQLGQTARYHYDENGNLTHETTFFGLEKTYAYDTSNRRTKEIESSHITNYTYNSLNQKISTTDYLGATVQYVYDARDNLLKESKPNGAITSYAYDAASNPTATTDPRNFTTSTTYNIYGKPFEILHPDGTKENCTYTITGLLESHTDQEGTTTRYTYDILDRPLTKTILDPSGTILSQEKTNYSPFHKFTHTNALGHTTTYHYNGAGELIKETCPEHSTTYTYDALGRKATESIDSLTRHYTYDLLDRLLSEKHYERDKLLYQIDHTYDAQGNIASNTRYPNNQPATETWEYDLFGRKIAHENALHHRTTTSYKETNHLYKITHHPNKTTTVETYNPLNQLISIEKLNPQEQTIAQESYSYDLSGNETSHLIDVYYGLTKNHQFLIQKGYDSLNRLSLLTENKTKITHYNYTPTGRLTTLTKPDGVQLFYTYNALGHQTRLNSSDGTVDYTTTHNLLGQLLTSTNNVSGRSFHRTLDNHGNILTEILPSGHSLTNTYDSQLRRTSLTLSTGHQTIYTYDGENLHSATTNDLTTSYIWDLNNNLLSKTLPNGATISHTIDPLARTISHHSPYHNQTLDQFDSMGNLLSETYNGTIQNYTYNFLNELIAEPSHQYSYDSLSNRLSKDNTIYTLNIHNQLESCTYDPNGNPTHTKNHTIIYDALDRPIRIDNNTYSYDSQHRREDLIWDGKHDLGTPEMLRILGPTPNAEIGAAILIFINGKPHIPIHDLQGNQTALLDLKGTLLEKQLYSAFGEKQRKTNSLTPWGYRSKRQTATLIDFGRRLYDPDLGRFLTPYPEGYTDSSNLYAYVKNNPLIYQDPYGLLTEQGRRNRENTINAIKGISHGTVNFVMDSFHSLQMASTIYGSSGDGNIIFPDKIPMIKSLHQEQAIHTAKIDNWMLDTFSIDRSNSIYQSFRSYTYGACTVGSMAYGGYGASVFALNKFAKVPVALSRIIKGESIFAEHILTRTKIKSYLLNAESLSKKEIISDLESIGLRLKGKSPNSKFLDFQDRFGNIRIKIHPPDRTTPYNHLHIYNKMGNPLNKHLKKVDRRSLDAHIPYGGE